MWPVLLVLVLGDGMGELPLAHLPDALHGSKASKSQGQSPAEKRRLKGAAQSLQKAKGTPVTSHLNSSCRALQGCRTAGSGEHAPAALFPQLCALKHRREAAKLALCQVQFQLLLCSP